MVALKWSMRHVFGIELGDVWFAASDIGAAHDGEFLMFYLAFSHQIDVLFERMGRGPLVHCLRPASARRDVDPIRGQTCRNTRCALQYCYHFLIVSNY